MKPSVEIVLDKKRHLRYSLKALSVMESEFQKPIHQINFDALTIQDLVTVIYAGLIHEDDSLTKEHALTILDEYGELSDITEKLREALEVSFGSTTTEKNIKGPKRTGIGNKSPNSHSDL